MNDKTITVIKFDATNFDATSWRYPRQRSRIEPEQKRGKPA
jgi:hypothetical protein